MKILVTGGAGYIGSTVTDKLIRTGNEVVVLDNLSQGHLLAVPNQATFVLGDLADRIMINEVLQTHQPEAIMHFASNTLVGESMNKPFLYLRDNIINGINLIQGAVEHGIRRFILSSTANLFGQPKEVPIPTGATILPGSPYGESKNVLERLLHWMDELYGLKYATLRYFNACGAASPDLGEDHEPETHLIPLVLQVALGKRDKIIIYGDDYDTHDGTCVRDYIHVLDLAQAHILALNILDNGSRKYNLGTGRGFSVKEVIDTARRVTGHPIPAEVGERRPGDPAVLIASSEKIRRELGWRPLYPDLFDIVNSAWQWHMKHPDGYDQ